MRGEAPVGRSFWTHLGSTLHALAGLARSSTVRRAFWVLVFVVGATIVFASVSLHQQVNLTAGEVAPVTIKAPTRIENGPATQAARLQAAQKVAPIYSTDPSTTQSSLDVLSQQATVIEKAQQSWRSAVVSASASSVSASLASAAAKEAASKSSASQSSASGKTAATSVTPQSAQTTTSSQPASSTAPTASVPVIPAPSLSAAAAALGKRLGGGAPIDQLEAAVTASGTQLTAAVSKAYSELQSVMEAGVEPSQVAAARQQVTSAAATASAPAALDTLVGSLAAGDLQVNKTEDVAAYNAAVRAAKAAVKPVYIPAGAVIVRSGDQVSPTDISILTAAGLLNTGGTFGVLAGAAALALLLLALCWAFLSQFYRAVLRDEVRLVLFGSLVVASLTAVRLGHALSPFLAPTPWAAMLASVAFGPSIAIFVGGVTGLGAGLIDHNLTVAACALVGAWTAVFALWRVRQRSDLLRAGLYSAVAETVAVLVLVGLFLGQSTGASTTLLSPALANTPPLLLDVIATAFTGILSGVLAIGTLPYAEVLGVLTPFQLLEMGNPSQPLLRRLLVEAPGTYHHSLMVGNLAEAACEQVGGDALLVRTAAYYHDIGKMKRPAFFVENQQGGRNPHDDLPPRLSAQIITSHVRDGVDLARQSRLSRELVHFIRTHHGTTLVQYFYHSACREQEAAGGEPVSESDFRYPGPLPSTRESAVLMLADGVEAAVRSLQHPSEEEIEATIRHIIRDRLEDGQLESAPLTLADLHAIEVTFLRILVGVYHTRIQYPESPALDAGGVAPGA